MGYQGGRHLGVAGELAEEHGARRSVYSCRRSPRLRAETFARGHGCNAYESHRSQPRRGRTQTTEIWFRGLVRRHGLPPDSDGGRCPTSSGRWGGRACILQRNGWWSLNRGRMAGRIALLASRIRIMTSGRPIIVFLPSVSPYPGSRRIIVGHGTPERVHPAVPTPCRRL